jgi:hypothetical protein
MAAVGVVVQAAACLTPVAVGRVWPSAGLEGLGCDLGVEAQPWSWPVAECDRAELGGVFVHPRTREPELPRELARVEQLHGHAGRAGGALGWVVA